MKFNKLVRTFKNGLVSPLMRGRTDVEGLDSSAEEFSNFYADQSGAALRRPRMMYQQQPVAIVPGTKVPQILRFTILGEDYTFLFNYNETLSNFNAADPTDGNSTFVKIIKNSTNQPARCIPWAPSASGPFTSRENDWLAPASSTPYLSGLKTLMDVPVKVLQYTQISDRTIVFTTENNFPFYISLIDVPKFYGTPASSDTRLNRRFIIAPYFVSLATLSKAFRGDAGTTAQDCPILPINYPFNSPNADTTIKVFVEKPAGQTGVDTVSGILAKNTEAWFRTVYLPYSIIPDNSSIGQFVGSFIRLQTVDSKEAVFFLTKAASLTVKSNVTYDGYDAIQVVGGVIDAAGTSVFALSSWGNFQGYPKVVGNYFGRLMLANAAGYFAGASQASSLWAAAVNSRRPNDFQAIMADVLKQDEGAADVSGMLYYEKTVLNIRGFQLPLADAEGQPINWVSNRRRFHVGTGAGEFQLTVRDSFTRDTAEATKGGSIASALIQTANGDRKILYLANDGRELRYISVEDKDYESVDNSLSTVLVGLGFKATKIQWWEKYRLLLILNENKEVYVMSFDTSSGIKAFAKWEFGFEIIDIAASIRKASIIIKTAAGNYKLYDIEGYDSLTTYYDLHTIDPGQMNYLAEEYAPCTLKWFKNGVQTTLTIPTGFIAASGNIAITNPGFDYTGVIGVSFKSRLKTMPLEEGSNIGGAVGDIKRIHQATVQVYASGPFDFGSNDGNLETTDKLVTTELRTQNVSHDFPQSPDEEQVIIIETEEPTALNISGIALRGVTYQGE